MIAVSIVVHKTPSLVLNRALQSLLKEEVDKIYVIDNSPTDELRREAQINGKIEYIRVPNKGYGAGNNIALKKSIEDGTEFHLVMNPDVYWDGNILPSLIEKMKQNPDIGLIAPRLLNPDGSIQQSVRPLPTPLSLIRNRLTPNKSFKKKPLIIQNSSLITPNFPTSPDSNNFTYFDNFNNFYLLGAFLLFRTESLKQVGLFDERFFLYPEDIDISRRIQKNWQVIYCPEVSVYHEYQRASAKNLKMFVIHCVNMIRYFNKWGWK